MGSLENPNCTFDFPLIDDITGSAADFGAPVNGFVWNSSRDNCSNNICMENCGSLVDVTAFNESGSKKCGRSESSSAPSSKTAYVSRKCTHCGKIGHTKARCYEIIRAQKTGIIAKIRKRRIATNPLSPLELIIEPRRVFNKPLY